MQIGRIAIWDDQVPLEHLRSLRGTMEKLWQYIYSGGVANYTSVARRTNTNRALDFLFITASWTLSWAAVHSQAALSSSAWGQDHLLYITIIQAYAPTSDYDGDAVEDFYEHLQEILDHSLKNGTLVVLGDWNAKVGEDALKNWKGTCGR